MAIDEEKLERMLADISDQNALILANQDAFQNEVRNLASRVATAESRIAQVEHRSDPPPTFRAPMASLTSEEKSSRYESIRVEVANQTPILEKQSRSLASQSKWMPIAVFLGIVLSTAVNNCHIELPTVRPKAPTVEVPRD
jgi:peptidoglycan hydrolase CwlO-like protein